MKLSKEERSWILYDCGNSAYSMAVTTALLPIIFGMFENVGSSMDLGYFNSIASILVAVLSPILGTIADYKDRKKRFFIFLLRSVSLPLPPWPSCPRTAVNGSGSSPFTFCQRSASPGPTSSTIPSWWILRRMNGWTRCLPGVRLRLHLQLYSVRHQSAADLPAGNGQGHRLPDRVHHYGALVGTADGADDPGCEAEILYRA